MFCPKCGNANQTENTYCRQCGTFLPDFNKLEKKTITPEQHLKANTVLNFLTAGTSLTLAILLYCFFLGQTGTHPVIYATAGFLIAIFGWQVQIIIRTFQLKKHFKNPKTRRKLNLPQRNLKSPQPTNYSTKLILRQPFRRALSKTRLSTSTKFRVK